MDAGEMGGGIEPDRVDAWQLVADDLLGVVGPGLRRPIVVAGWLDYCLPQRRAITIHEDAVISFDRFPHTRRS